MLLFSLLAIVTALFLLTVIVWRISRKLGGITGDILGASSEMMEVLVLVVFCLLP